MGIFMMLMMSSCVFFRPSSGKLFKKALREKPYDVVIVPGCPFDGKEWTMAMRGRVIWANYLVKTGIANKVIFSGGAVYTPYVEAEIMALYAIELGMPKDKIIIEDKAEHSVENIYNSYWIAKNMGYTKIAVASDPFQSKMLMGFTKRRFKLPIAHIPFVIDTLKKIHNVSPVINPESAKVINFTPITERETTLQRMRGTNGKNINFQPE
jgi:hypothetical protein